MQTIFINVLVYWADYFILSMFWVWGRFVRTPRTPLLRACFYEHTKNVPEAEESREWNDENVQLLFIWGLGTYGYVNICE